MTCSLTKALLCWCAFISVALYATVADNNMKGIIESRFELGDEYFNENNVEDLVTKIYAENCYFMPDGHTTITGREGVTEYWGAVAAFTDAQDHVKEVYGKEGDPYVISRSEFQAVMGNTAVGRHFKNFCLSILCVTNSAPISKHYLICATIGDTQHGNLT